MDTGAVDREPGLIVAARAGDREAFAALVALRDRGLRRFVAARAWDRDQLEEVVQATWVAAWRGLSGWRGDGPFAAWLTGIARNQLRRAAEDRRRRGGASDEALAGLAAVDPDAAEAEETEARAARLDDCLARLEPRLRTMLLAHDRDGEALAALAIRFRIDRARIATALWRARALLRLCIAGTQR